MKSLRNQNFRYPCIYRVTQKHSRERCQSLCCAFVAQNSHVSLLSFTPTKERQKLHKHANTQSQEHPSPRSAKCCRVLVKLRAPLQTSVPEQWDHARGERWHNEIWQSQPRRRLHMFHISNSQTSGAGPSSPFPHSALVAYDNLSLALCALAAERRWEVFIEERFFVPQLWVTLC